ncbi:hypothetical protein CIPAW_03G230200 [Carya illinoinensis]|uniref:Uncharacterized protein n=1 Tax=Carya illinoinensis TaxID=32201 RepID=A0A8T1R541_CARIL|nr:hypothetical protein CIPAW_03G230200 [Carya illinoinensis]KAG6662249.1 hypothetical protein CIPAW_03G230200 [Carya illinoinensis]
MDLMMHHAHLRDSLPLFCLVGVGHILYNFYKALTRESPLFSHVFIHHLSWHFYAPLQCPKGGDGEIAWHCSIPTVVSLWQF